MGTNAETLEACSTLCDAVLRIGKGYKAVLGLLGTLCVLTLAAPIVHSQEKSTQGAIQVHVVITNEAVRGDSEAPTLQPDDVKVKQGKNFLKVNQLIPAQGDNAALQPRNGNR
jgi:hypothetical protein